MSDSRNLLTRDHLDRRLWQRTVTLAALFAGIAGLFDLFG